MFRSLASRWSLVPASLAFVVLLSLANRGEARPKYKSAFEKTYPQCVKKDGKLTCVLCHSATDDKTIRNHYGEALAKELGEKNVKDDEKIVEALRAIEDGECRSGKWKLRLEHGRAPCICGRRDHEADSYISRQLTRERHEDR